MNARPLLVAEVADQVRALGVVAGGVLLVHTSFRAVRPVAGGPAGLIEALRAALGPSGTLVMPSWTGDDDAPFDSAATPCAADLGVVADVFWRVPGVARSAHPIAFAAAGPLATSIVAGPLPIPPHGPSSPVARVVDAGGQVLLLGVGHDASTVLHLAEVLAGVPYGILGHCTLIVDGRPVRVEYRENDHCCERFALVDGWLGARQVRGAVGHAEARLFRAADAVSVAVERLRGEPLVFLHPSGSGCDECERARGSIP